MEFRKRIRRMGQGESACDICAEWSGSSIPDNNYSISWSCFQHWLSLNS